MVLIITLEYYAGHILHEMSANACQLAPTLSSLVPCCTDTWSDIRAAALISAAQLLPLAPPCLSDSALLTKVGRGVVMVPYPIAAGDVPNLRVGA